MTGWDCKVDEQKQEGHIEMNSPVTEKVFVSMKCSRALDSTLANDNANVESGIFVWRSAQFSLGTCGVSFHPGFFMHSAQGIWYSFVTEEVNIQLGEIHSSAAHQPAYAGLMD
ncbi:uncharacterized protein BO96DRAFT_439748 [Aspergillus niger CBS 101883]|uniref:Uncharacterized protein n=2 Tax=Aspergillus niger TaxID=5061 RepID=A2R944_ASPNC|nr:uncharacterized protein BO96DRAFT_439748 [Aspergillus niger CBS 101883]XP_059604954.1 hypothetical protein An17g00050 [Aspergillus niger]PYH50643.1 hypothetical protein BO96DRAFT_439748 [Aspergillus niger CBS 101883]CAK47135.1 hypothetical protein An17g00050 [Aspergillus niger]